MPTRTQTSRRRAPARTQTSRRPTIAVRRRAPEPSTTQKAMQGLKRAIPTGGAAKGKPSSTRGKAAKGKSGSTKGKAAGLAALAGAAGLALSQRDKLKHLFSHDDKSQSAATPGPERPAISGMEPGTTTGGLEPRTTGEAGVSGTGDPAAAADVRKTR
jgi:hypothetical protein